LGIIHVTFHFTYVSGDGIVVIIVSIPGNQVNIKYLDFLGEMQTALTCRQTAYGEQAWGSGPFSSPHRLKATFGINLASELFNTVYYILAP